MTLHVYDTPTGPEHLYKDLSTVISPSETGWFGAVRGEVTVESPVVEVQAAVTEGNYAYIPDFARYYWIRKKTVIRRDLTELQLESDPLMTFAGQILDLPIIARRSSLETNVETDPGCNAYLPDHEQPVLVPTVEDVYLMHTFEPGSYILVTIG